MSTYKNDLSTLKLSVIFVMFGTWGGVVVKALRYWSGGLGIDFR